MKKAKEKREEQSIEIKKTNIIAIVIIVLVGLAGAWAYTQPPSEADGNTTPKTESKIVLIQPVSAEEVGSMFVCPCCGNPITKGCCGMAKERMLYIEAQAEAGLNKTEIINNMVKKYGLTAMMEGEREKYRAELIKNAPEDRPKIEITPVRYDFKDVSVAGGTVSKNLKVENKGTQDLIIDKIETSCGCTSASLIVDGVEGPIFSMPGHGKQPVGWSATIPPGGEAQLKIYYDTRVHPDMRGKGTRTIDVSSNDPIDITKQVKIEFNQVA